MLSKLSWKPLALAGALAFAAVPAMAQQISLGTMSAGTVSNLTGNALATVLSANGVPVTVRPGTGESEVNALVANNVTQLGIASVLEVANAVKGQGVYQGAPQANLRVLAALSPLQVGLFVRAGSDIDTLAELRGHNVPRGFTTSATLDQILLAVLANAGLTAGDVSGVTVADLPTGVAEFQAGRTDAFFFALPGGAVAQADAAVGGLRLLPLSDAADAVARQEAVFPEGSLVVRQAPTPAMRGFTGPTAVMQYDNLLLVNADVPDATVQQILTVLAANKPALVAAFPGFGDFQPAAMYKPDLGLPYHPAAVAWFAAQPAPATP